MKFKFTSIARSSFILLETIFIENGICYSQLVTSKEKNINF